MPIHWTYEEFSPESDLFQGDVLEPTQKLRSILREVHPHFLDPKYIAFLLVTQSCDLVLRKGTPTTKYLNVAVVRPVTSVLHDFLGHVCRTVADGVYLQESKGEAHRLLDRLFNQNEQALGLYYLHPDAEAGIAEPSVALLRVTVTLRVEHYEIVKDARRGRLRPEFRSKLGWLVGNLYSRVGTEDWSEPPDRKKDLQKLVRECLDSRDAPNGPVWIPESWVMAARDRGVQIEQIERAKLPDVLRTVKPPSPKEQIIEQTLCILKEVVPSTDDETLDRIRHRLGNDPVFAKATRVTRPGSSNQD